MYEQEKHQETHFLILAVYSLLCMAMILESLILGWNREVLVLVVLGMAISWTVHIMDIIPAKSRIWLYFGFSMMTTFFYGTHESSIYDLAPIIICVIILYSAIEAYSLIRFCVIMYFLILLYNFLFVLKDGIVFSPLMISRTFFHIVIVCLVSWLVKKTIHRGSKERKHTDEKIRELEEINRRTENFLTNVSHELRTPINAVTGIAAMMMKNEEDDAKKKDIVSIQKAGRRLVEQIEDILDYTEIDTGKITVTEEVYMLSSMINSLIAEQRLREDESDLELIFDIDAGIPAELIGDEKKIKKILKHLISNALKFTERGGAYVRIFALQKSYGINLCITVNDTGSGIAEKDFEKIKERFYQANSGRNRKAGGLGLGLPIVYGLVSAMGGFMKMESVHGKGTLISVSIPQKVVDKVPGLWVDEKQKLCLAYFMQPEKFQVTKVRTFYDSLISNMVRELGISLHRVYGTEELKKLVDTYRLTHLFTGEAEYMENQECFQALDPDIQVVIVAKPAFVLPEGARARILKKPFSVLGVVNILNSEMTETADEFQTGRICCPGIRTLVVDDEPMNLMVAEGIFSDYQMQVTTAESGLKAVELCEKESFDLIFLDHMMPEMDGVETMKRIRRLTDGSAVKIIAFTANAVSGARKMFLQEGFDEFVSKPIEIFELERVLRKVLPDTAVVLSEEKPDTAVPVSEPLAEKEKDPMHLLEQAGIHTKSGMQYCRNDRAFYEELLLNFAQSAQGKRTEIQKYYAEENWKNYGTMVHAMKSTAKMIGADELSERAEKAEAAAKNTDIPYIREHHDSLLAQYEEITEEILSILGAGNTEETAESEQEICADELQQHLKQLAEVLETYEADRADKLLAEAADLRYQGEKLCDLFADIRRDVEEFEFEAALEKVKVLQKSAEGSEAE